HPENGRARRTPPEPIDRDIAKDHHDFPKRDACENGSSRAARPPRYEQCLVEEDRLESFAIHRKERRRGERQRGPATDGILYFAAYEAAPLGYFHLRKQPVAHVEQNSRGGHHREPLERLTPT